MLRSAEPAAYSALFHAGIALLARPVDALLQRTERASVSRAAASDLPLIFVVGAPRSGTTLVYQVLSHALDVTYFDNANALFPRSPLTAARLLHRVIPHRQTRFRSFYGQTAGFRGPNDGFHVWNRFLGSDRYTTPDQLSDQLRLEMTSFFNAWLSTFKKPFVNKNNRNTDCIELLAAALPNSYWVLVTRNPFFVAQSLIQARANVQGSKQVGWGLRSRTSDSADPLGYVDDVCDQILAINRRLDQARSAVGPQRLLEVNYEDFCRSPTDYVEQIIRRLPPVTKRFPAAENLAPFAVSETIKLDGPEAARVREKLGLDG